MQSNYRISGLRPRHVMSRMGGHAKRVAELIPVRAKRIHGMHDFSEDVDAMGGQIVDLIFDKSVGILENGLNLIELLLVGGSKHCLAVG